MQGRSPTGWSTKIVIMPLKLEQPGPPYQTMAEFQVMGQCQYVTKATPTMTKWIWETCINPLAPMGRGPMQDHQSDKISFHPHRHHQGFQFIEKPKAQPSPILTVRNRKERLGMPLQWQPTLVEKGQEHFQREQVMSQSHRFCTGQVPAQRHCKSGVVPQ